MKRIMNSQDDRDTHGQIQLELNVRRRDIHSHNDTAAMIDVVYTPLPVIIPMSLLQLVYTAIYVF